MTGPDMSIEHIGVIGAGQMGRGIAQLAASYGFAVTLADAQRDIAERGRGAIAQQLAKLVDKQKVTAADRDQIMARIQPTDLYGGELEAVDFVIEAATENFTTKREIFAALDQACRGGVVLATNTSSISITAIGAAVTRPERVIGMHFMNPPPLMKLVEIIRGLATADATYATTRALAERLGIADAVVELGDAIDELNGRRPAALLLLGNGFGVHECSQEEGFRWPRNVGSDAGDLLLVDWPRPARHRGDEAEGGCAG